MHLQRHSVEVAATRAALLAHTDGAVGTQGWNKSIRVSSPAWASPTKGLIIAHQAQNRLQASSGRELG